MEEAARRYDCHPLWGQLPHYVHSECGPTDDVPDFSGMSAKILPLLMDPVEFCQRVSDKRGLAGEVQALVAAFSLRMGALVAGVQVDKSHFAALHLPPGSWLRTGILPRQSPTLPFSPPCDTESSDDELVLPSVAHLASTAPVATPHQSSCPVFSQPGPAGLHEADVHTG